MSIEDYARVELATVRGEPSLVVQEQENGDYLVLDEKGESRYVDSRDLTSLVVGIVLPLPKVTASGNTLSANGQTWHSSAADVLLEDKVAQGASAAAVLLHRKAEAAKANLTDDLVTVLNREVPVAEAVARIREALSRGAQLIRGDVLAQLIEEADQ